MRWIIPAVVVAITALIVFQVNWLVREAEMKTLDEKRRVGEALRETCIAMEEHEAKGFIGNSLDSVFIRQPYPGNDSMSVRIIDDSTQQIIVINNSDSPGYSNFEESVRPVPALPPIPPRAPVPPAPGVPPLPSMPPLPPGNWVLADSGNAQVIVRERQQRVKAAMKEKMMEYVFRSDAPRSLDTAVLDSTLKAELTANGIEYKYDRTIVAGRRDNRIHRDTASDAETEWQFRAPLYPGDPHPFSPEIVVQIDPGNGSVFMRILPQIIFSVLITLGMLLLFLMIYREALKQKKIGEIRRDFINNMTHEFKTPLATMSLAADTIMNEKIIGDKEKVKYYAEQIKAENRKLNQQVEKVLELALTEKTGVIMNKERLNLTEVVLRAIKAMEMQVEAKSGTIVMENSPEIILIDADPFHLERVFVNLFDNALKYGGTPPKITINIEQYRGGTEIKITDNGKGIASSDWNLIFEPFHRVSTGDIHNVKGFGLGLSYAQSVMSEHNGSVSVTKSNHSGTTFTVILKYAPKQN